MEDVAMRAQIKITDYYLVCIFYCSGARLVFTNLYFYL
jgi:hypothetical protein